MKRYKKDDKIEDFLEKGKYSRLPITYQSSYLLRNII